MIWAWADRGEEMIAGPIEATVDILSELKSSGMRCYALTNMEAETYPLRLERFEFLSWFDGTVVSGFEKIAKPDSEIFVRLLERFGLVATNTLMIDDRPENLESAQRLGLVPLLFRSPGQLRVQLESMSLLSNHS
jgi:2-haloacid dehalogenase